MARHDSVVPNARHQESAEPFEGLKTTRAYFGSRFTYDEGRDGAWQAICRYLQRYVPVEGRVLDLGAGYCSFVNNVQAREKHAIDVFPEFVRFARTGVRTHVGTCADLNAYTTGHFDAVFASNLLEHLTRTELFATLAEVRRVLKPGGRLITVQPNYRRCYREYFDDYTHMLAFSHVSLGDLMAASGFEVERSEPRFLPLSFKSRLPSWPWLVSLYLRLPFRPLAKQMLVVGRRITD